jgi:hypothetical protein
LTGPPAATHRPALRELGVAALDTARGSTHEKMHARRAEIIQAARMERGESRT